MDAVYNWHITEKCNYRCYFCYGKWGSPKEIHKDPDALKSIITEIKKHGRLPFGNSENGGVRVNIAGGEPLLLGDKLLNVIDELRLAGLKVSIITNGYLLKKQIQVVDRLDMLGLSIDSSINENNLLIGRSTKKGRMLSFEDMKILIELARRRNPSLKIKLNVVVNHFNYHEPVINKLQTLSPDKIKVFRELSAGQHQAQLTDRMYEYFLRTNASGLSQPNVIIEDNDAMTQSYLMIDPRGRFFQNGSLAGYLYSRPIQDVGLATALKDITFDENKFLNRYVSHETR